ncbi:MAG: Hpt domain-containing protein, partial [Burkholderiales bacterium]
FDALVARSLPEEPRLQRLCNRIEQQIKRLIDGSPTVAERLMREALFQVARARPATPHLRAVQETYRLAGTVPATFELRTDRGSAEPVLAAMRELVVQAKGAWTKFSSGHLASLAGFGEQVAALGARAGELGNPDLGVLGRAMSAVASALAGHPERFGDATAMEVATTLLLVENALERLDSLSPEFHEQAAVMSARLAACAKGEPPTAAPDVPLLDEMSRRAQERLLMAQVVAEMQSNLRAIEQALDAFFRAPDKRTELPGLDKPVKQVLGALTMLGEERAATVLAECEQNIRRFGAPEYEPDKADFESIAAALSGLGFYVDALQHGKADFDAMMKPLAPATPTPVEEVEVHSPAVTVEVELEQAKRQARTLYEAWRETPADEGLRAELRRNLAAIQKDAGLVADAALEKKAAEAQKLVAAEATRAFDPALQSAMFAIAGAPIVEHAPSAETAKLAESSSEAIDAELLAIFLEEATEVLESIRTQLDEAKGRPQAVEVLRTIRRGFHTLKGSGRMVGLARLGEAAWAVEQVMNRWLEDEQAGTPDLFKLVAFAHAYFAAGVVALKAGGTCPDEQQVVAAADRLKQGEPLGELSLSVETPVSAVAPTAELEIAVSEGGAVGPAEPPPTPTSDALDAIRPPAAVEPITLDFALPEAQADSAPEAVAVPERGNELPSLDFSMPLSVPTEARAPAPETLSLDFALDEPTEADAASSAPADEPASLDFSIPVATPTTASAPPHEIHAVPSEAPAQEELVRIGEVELSPALYAIFVSEAQSHLAAMRAGAEALGDGIPVSETFQRAAHTLAGIAGTVRLDALRELGHALELALARSHDTFPAAEDGALFAEAIAAIEKMVEDASARRLPAATPELVARLDVVGVAAATPPAASSVDVDAMESNVEQGTAPCEPVPEVADAQAPADLVSLPLPEMTAHAVAEPAQPVSDRVVAFPGVTDEPSPAPSLEVKVEEIPVERRQRRLDDDLDRELLPIFLEEAAELVPSVGQSLRDWGAQPENRAVGHRLQRLLHTLKGSARMCGAMALGELTHAMETRIENALALSTIPATLLDELELSYDRMGSL